MAADAVAVAALLLLLPLVAMQLTGEVTWDEADFLVMGALLFGACGAFELAARMTGNTAYRAGVGVAVITAFLLIWINLAVEIIGSEDNPANLMYVGVLAVAIIGAVIGRFLPEGMARAGRDGARPDPGGRDRSDRGMGLHGSELAPGRCGRDRVLRRVVAQFGVAVS